MARNISTKLSRSGWLLCAEATAWSGQQVVSQGHAADRVTQRWQVLFDDQSDCPEVNAEVAMHDHVAEPGEFSPRNVCFSGLDLVRQALARFGQGLQIADYRVLDQT